MNIYRIRSKETGEFFENTNSKTIWLSKGNASKALGVYSYLKNYKEWRSQWEIVEFELKEVRVCS